jgi:hypothetical protein
MDVWSIGKIKFQKSYLLAQILCRLLKVSLASVIGRSLCNLLVWLGVFGCGGTMLFMAAFSPIRVLLCRELLALSKISLWPKRGGRVHLSKISAEAMAVLLAIQLCREMGFTRVHLEGDAKVVVDAVNYVDVDKSWMGHSDDIKVELNSLVH